MRVDMIQHRLPLRPIVEPRRPQDGVEVLHHLLLGARAKALAPLLVAFVDRGDGDGRADGVDVGRKAKVTVEEIRRPRASAQSCAQRRKRVVARGGVGQVAAPVLGRRKACDAHAGVKLAQPLRLDAREHADLAGAPQGQPVARERGGPIRGEGDGLAADRGVAAGAAQSCSHC